jgi:hypothetical protein
MKSWLRLARRPDVVRRSAWVAVVVGSILALVNYVDRLFTGALVPLDLVKIGLTYLVPYGVSTYASVQAIRERREEEGP